MIILRFLYINIFAFLLLGLSAVVIFLPRDIFYYISKTLFVLFPLVGGVGIFKQWRAKNRKLKTLVLRNIKMIRFDTFTDLRQTLCGWVLVDIALRELRKTETYKPLTKKQWKAVRRIALGWRQKD